MNNKPKSKMANFQLSQYTSFIGYILEGVVLFLLIVYFFVPSYTETQNLRDEVDLKKKELNEETTYANYLKEIAGALIEFDEEMVNYALPSENDVITLIVTYEGLASQNEEITVDPVDLSPGVLTQEDVQSEEGLVGTQTVEFDMNVSGTNEQKIREFIDEITNTRRIFDITSLSWDAPDSDSEDGEIEITISINTYYYIESRVNAKRSLVKQGVKQDDFIAQLKAATVFEDLILEGVELGKDDLFEKVSTVSAHLISQEV